MSEKMLSFGASVMGGALLLIAVFWLVGGGHVKAGPVTAEAAIGQDASVQLSPGYSQYAAPGSVVTYAHTLTNTGLLTDTFSLEATNSHGWTVTLSSAELDGTPSLSLTVSGGGGTAAFTVSVAVPSTVSASITATTLVTATPVSPTVFAAITDTTVVSTVTRYAYLPLLARNHIPDWSQGGLAGHTVYQIAVCARDPRYLYAGTETGVFRSSDGGASWQTTGLQGILVRGLDVATDCNHVYAATWNRYVQHSTDGGDHWNTLSTGLDDPLLYTVVIDPSSNRLYAGTDTRGVYSSSDDGVSWQHIFSYRAEPHASTIPRLSLPASDTLLVATWGGNAYRLTLAGTTWIPSPLSAPENNVFEVVQKDDGTLFAAAENHLYRKAVGLTETWQIVHDSRTYGVALDPDEPQVIYAATSNGAWYSSDGGAGFERLGLNGLAVRHIAPGPPQPKSMLLHAGTTNGAWRRTRPGSTIR